MVSRMETEEGKTKVIKGALERLVQVIEQWENSVEVTAVAALGPLSKFYLSGIAVAPAGLAPWPSAHPGRLCPA